MRNAGNQQRDCSARTVRFTLRLLPFTEEKREEKLFYSRAPSLFVLIIEQLLFTCVGEWLVVGRFKALGFPFSILLRLPLPSMFFLLFKRFPPFITDTIGAWPQTLGWNVCVRLVTGGCYCLIRHGLFTRKRGEREERRGVLEEKLF